MDNNKSLQEYMYRKTFIQTFITYLMQCFLQKHKENNYRVYCDKEQIAMMDILSHSRSIYDITMVSDALFDLNMLTSLFGVTNSILKYNVDHIAIDLQNENDCDYLYAETDSFVRAKISIPYAFKFYIYCMEDENEGIANRIDVANFPNKNNFYTFRFDFGYHSIEMAFEFQLEPAIKEYYRNNAGGILNDIFVALNILFIRAFSAKGLIATCEDPKYSNGFVYNDNDTIDMDELNVSSISEKISQLMNDRSDSISEILKCKDEDSYGREEFIKAIMGGFLEGEDLDEILFKKALDPIKDGNIATKEIDPEIKMNLIDKGDMPTMTNKQSRNKTHNSNISFEKDIQLGGEEDSSDINKIDSVIVATSKYVIEDMHINISDYKKVYNAIMSFLKSYTDINYGKAYFKEISMGGLPENMQNLIILCFDNKNTAVFGIGENPYQIINISSYAGLFKSKIESLSNDAFKTYPRIITISENAIRDHKLNDLVYKALNASESNPFIFYKDCMSLIAYGFLLMHIQYINSSNKYGGSVTVVDNPSFTKILDAFENSSMFQDAFDVDCMIGLMNLDMSRNDIPYFRGKVPPDSIHITFPNGDGIIYAFGSLFKKRNTNVSCFYNDAQFIASCHDNEIQIPKSDYIFKANFKEDIVKILNYIKYSNEDHDDELAIIEDESY